MTLPTPALSLDDALDCARNSMRILSGINERHIRSGILNAAGDRAVAPMVVELDMDGVKEKQKVVGYFKRHRDQWFLQQTITAGYKEDRDTFGSSIVLDPTGQILMIHALPSSDNPTTYRYRLENDLWELVEYRTRLQEQATMAVYADEPEPPATLRPHRTVRRLCAVGVLVAMAILLATAYNNFYLASLLPMVR